MFSLLLFLFLGALQEEEPPKLIQSLKGASQFLTTIALSRDGKVAAAADSQGMVFMWYLPTAEPIRINAHAKSVFSLAISPDGRHLISGGADGKIRSWSIPAGKPESTLSLDSIPNPVPVFSLSFSPDGNHIAAGIGETEPKVAILRSEGLKELGRLSVFEAPAGGYTVERTDLLIAYNPVAFTPDGKKLAAAQWSQGIRTWDFKSQRPILSIESKVGTWSSGGKDFPNLGRNASNKLANIRGLAFGPNGKQMASTGDDSYVRIFEAESGRPVAILEGHQGAIASLHFHRTRNVLLSGGQDGVRCWNLATLKELWFLDSLHGGDAHMETNQEGSLLACLSPEGVKLFQFSSGVSTGEKK